MIPTSIAEVENSTKYKTAIFNFEWKKYISQYFKTIFLRNLSIAHLKTFLNIVKVKYIPLARIY